jgi:hypothetical protein
VCVGLCWMQRLVKHAKVPLQNYIMDFVISPDADPDSDSDEEDKKQSPASTSTSSSSAAAAPQSASKNRLVTAQIIELNPWNENTDVSVRRCPPLFSSVASAELLIHHVTHGSVGCSVLLEP